jgi:DNA-binding IclR family transcriptional regulator
MNKGLMSDHTDANDANFSGTVLKALDVLECLAEYRRPMTTQEIAKACAMSRPTTYRLLTTLMSRGFVRDDGNYQYALGTKFLSLSSIVLNDINLLKLATPHLHELCLMANETANLSILDGAEILYIGKEESRSSTEMPMMVQLRSTVGTRLMLHCTGMGKAILAHLPAQEQYALIEKSLPLKAYAVNTITHPDKLVQELDRIRERGYAIDDREVDDGTRCVAAPIFDSSQRVIAAMSIAGPAYRLTPDHLHRLSPEIIRVTQTLSGQLGYVGRNGK